MHRIAPHRTAPRTASTRHHLPRKCIAKWLAAVQSASGTPGTVTSHHNDASLLSQSSVLAEAARGASGKQVV